jgi:hypothetical protein
MLAFLNREIVGDSYEALTVYNKNYQGNRVRNFVPAILFSIACLVLAAWYAIESGKPLATVMSLVIILGILEISLSFDNAIVNAAVLDDMDERWQRYF